jgi:hypothetical protein
MKWRELEMSKSMFLILTLGSIIMLASCGQAVIQTRYLYKPVTCPIPEIERAKLVKIEETDDLDVVLNKLIYNYGQLKEENLKLWNVINACKEFEKQVELESTPEDDNTNK